MLATANTGKKSGEVFEKNAGEWTGRAEICKEEIPGSKRSVYGYVLTYFRLEGRSSVISPDGTLISASEVPHCGASVKRFGLGLNKGEEWLEVLLFVIISKKVKIKRSKKKKKKNRQTALGSGNAGAGGGGGGGSRNGI